MEAASHSQGEAVHSRRNDGQHREVGIGKENKGISVKQMRPSNNMDQSYRSIAYNQYLSQAFGLQGEERPQHAAIQRLRVPEASEARPDSEMSAMTGDSMEVNFHMDPTTAPSTKDLRPKIQVTIPGKVVKRPHSSSHLATQMDRKKSQRRSRDIQTQVSPPSSTTHQQNAGDVPARLSVVSPLSVVEMPKPRRPFSAFSLESMTSDTPRNAPSLEKLPRSDSSDDTGEADDRSSKYSGRSSRSSLMEDTAVHGQSHNRCQSIAFSIISPAAAGVFDGTPLALKNNRLRAFKSTTSLATVDMNKPLPPEPGAEVAPLSIPYFRPGSMKGKRKVPSPLTFSRSSIYETPSQFPSRLSSLCSRYTPADLDALDAAFTETSPNMQPGSEYQHERSLSQAEAELEAHLGTINEEPTMQHPNLMPMAHDPLQISRGPNTMIPSRHAPHPPSSLKLSDGSISSRKRLQKKTSAHVVMQMRGDLSSNWESDDSSRSGLRRRISAPVVGSTAKADKVLGKSATVMARESSSESNWSSSESPQTMYDGDSSSPTMSREDSSTPETDVSSIPDHAYEEVRARLELLSPKNNNDSEHFATFVPKPKEYIERSSSVSRPLQTEANDAILDTKLLATTPETSSNAQGELTAPAIYLTPVEKFQESQVTIAIGLDASMDENDESNIHPLQRRGVQNELPQRRRSIASIVTTERPRSLASIAMSEIPDIYASLPSPGLTIRSRQSFFVEDVERDISADAAEVVLLRILENLDNLQDLFATATVSRGFYRTFKRHELPLMKNALYGMSPAAWELREMSPPYPGLESGDNALPKLLEYSPSLYLQHYMRDMYTMIALKSMILIHCESFLRADTITALAGGETERASQIDDAFWRVWSFCQVFGCGSNREDDIVGQMDWLRGGTLAKHQRGTANTMEFGADVNRNSVLYSSPPTFGKGNVGGLTAEDLYDMTEIWTCLGVLVRGFQGKRQEAREYGIFDKADVIVGDVEQEDSVLGTCLPLPIRPLLTSSTEEWTYHLLTLAPPTVLDVTSPTSPTAATFAHARSRGYTTWKPPTVSRATFLKEAVSRVYQGRVAERHPTSPIPSSNGNGTDPSSPISKQPMDDVVAARWRCARHAAEIRAKRSNPGFKALPPSEDRPMSEFPAVLEKLDMGNAPPVPVISSAHFRTPSDLDTSKNFVSALVVPAGPQVRDPVDVAVDRLVAMGFEKKKAAKALAETDTGNSVDFARALEWLVRERKRDVGGLMHSGYRGPSTPIGESDEIANANAESVIREAVGLGLNVGGRAWA